MARPSDPMLEEFRLIAEADLGRPGELDRLADAICDLFTDDCLLEDTSTTDVVRGRAELHDYCKSLFGPFSDVRIVPQEIFDFDTTSVMVLRISGKHTGDLYGHAATGRDVWFPAVAIYRCTDDCTKVRHETLAYDTGFIIAQIDDSKAPTVE
jgi:hypothetical protein